MAVTPEGKVKKLVRKVLEEFSPQLYSNWPVPSGYGTPSLDCLVCYHGVFIAIETKAPGKKLTPRQMSTLIEMGNAGAMTFIIENEEGCWQLRYHLHLIRAKHANDSK